MIWAWVAVVWVGVILSAWGEPGDRAFAIGGVCLLIAGVWAFLAFAALAVGSLAA